MSEYRCMTTVRASAEDVFAFVCDPANMPQYLPSVHEATVQDEDRVEMSGAANGSPFETDGWFDASWDTRRMEWGSNEDDRYSGWLQVTGDERSCQVTVYLEFESGSEKDGRTANHGSTIDQSLRNALKSIKSICEGTPIAQAADLKGRAYVD